MKKAVLIVKYYPIINNIWMGLILSGVISDKLYPFLGHCIIIDILLLMLSFTFKFCTWHRVLIYSMMVNVSLEFIQNCGVTFSNSVYLQLTITIISLVLSTILYYKDVCHFKKKTY